MLKSGGIKKYFTHRRATIEVTAAGTKRPPSDTSTTTIKQRRAVVRRSSRDR